MPQVEEEEAEEREGEVVEGENQQGPQPERKCNYQKVIVTKVVSCTLLGTAGRPRPPL